MVANDGSAETLADNLFWGLGDLIQVARSVEQLSFFCCIRGVRNLTLFGTNFATQQFEVAVPRFLPIQNLKQNMISINGKKEFKTDFANEYTELPQRIRLQSKLKTALRKDALRKETVQVSSRFKNPPR